MNRLFTVHEYGARRLSFGGLHPFAPGIDDFPFPAFLEVAVQQGKCRRVPQRFRRRICAFGQPDDDVGAGRPSRVQPEVLALRQVKGQLLVLLGIAFDKNGQAVRRDKPAERTASLLCGRPPARVSSCDGKFRTGGQGWGPSAVLNGCDLAAYGVDLLLGIGDTRTQFSFGRHIFTVLFEVLIHVVKRRFRSVERERDFGE